jgi:hypothetical protein
LYDTGPNAGIHSRTTFDTANLQPYSAVTDNYNAAGQELFQTGTRDDAGFAGYTWFAQYDYAGTESYSVYQNLYLSPALGGGLFQQTGTYNAGLTYGSWFTQYDPLGNQDYSLYQNFYLPNGVVQSQNGLYDHGPLAGDSWITTYDTDNSQLYSQFQNIYNAAGQVISQTGSYDSGIYSGDHWVTAFTTPGSTAHYDENIYDASGAVVKHNTA